MAHVIEDYRLSWLPAETVSEALEMTALVETFSALLYRVAFSVLRQSAEAEDVVQEVFLRVVEQQAKLPDVRDIRAWLVKIAWNLALDRKRRRQPVPLEDEMAFALASNDRPADQVLAEARELAAVLAVVEVLPTKERDVLLLSAVEELTNAEIAEILGRSEASVRSLLFRGRAHLQERLERTAWRSFRPEQNGFIVLRSGETCSPRASVGNLQVSPLRFAPVEMTDFGATAFPGGRYADTPLARRLRSR